MKILSKPKGNAEEYGRWAVNTYLGCQHGCEYCYLKKGPGAKNLGGDSPRLKAHVINEEHAYHLAMAEIIEHRDEIAAQGGLFFTFTSDPCTPATCNLTFRIAADAMNYGLPVTLLTKDAGFCDTESQAVRSFEHTMQVDSWLTNIAAWQTYKERLAIGFTLTGHDALEPHAPATAERLLAMKRLSEAGYRVWASIEPVITFDAAYDAIQDALLCGCRHLKIGLLTDRTRVVRRPFTLGGHDFPAYTAEELTQFAEYVMELARRHGATVYWKRSVEDLLAGPDKKAPRPVRGMTAREWLSQWPESVGAEWSMFG